MRKCSPFLLGLHYLKDRKDILNCTILILVAIGALSIVMQVHVLGQEFGSIYSFYNLFWEMLQHGDCPEISIPIFFGLNFILGILIYNSIILFKKKRYILFALLILVALLPFIPCIDSSGFAKY